MGGCWDLLISPPRGSMWPPFANHFPSPLQSISDSFLFVFPNCTHSLCPSNLTCLLVNCDIASLCSPCSRFTPWKKYICKSGSEAVTVESMFYVSERGERCLAGEGDDVPGIHEAEYLASECITAQNQRGRPRGALQWLPWKLLQRWGCSVFRRDRACWKKREKGFDRKVGLPLGRSERQGMQGRVGQDCERPLRQSAETPNLGALSLSIASSLIFQPTVTIELLSVWSSLVRMQGMDFLPTLFNNLFPVPGSVSAWEIFVEWMNRLKNK